MTTQVKQCALCEQIKECTQFYPKNNAKTRFSKWCNVCERNESNKRFRKSINCKNAYSPLKKLLSELANDDRTEMQNMLDTGAKKKVIAQSFNIDYEKFIRYLKKGFPVGV